MAVLMLEETGNLKSYLKESRSQLYENAEVEQLSPTELFIDQKQLLEESLQFSFVEREGFSLDRQGYIKKEEGLKGVTLKYFVPIMFGWTKPFD